MIGKVHSIQTLGTLDGPGVRFVLFLQGCNLRCGCCHNPDTWDGRGGSEADTAELVKKTHRIRIKEAMGVALTTVKRGEKSRWRG